MYSFSVRSVSVSQSIHSFTSNRTINASLQIMLRYMRYHTYISDNRQTGGGAKSHTGCNMHQLTVKRKPTKRKTKRFSTINRHIFQLGCFQCRYVRYAEHIYYGETYSTGRSTLHYKTTSTKSYCKHDSTRSSSRRSLV